MVDSDVLSIKSVSRLGCPFMAGQGPRCLAGPWPGPGWPRVVPRGASRCLAALGLALAGPWPGPWLALGLALAGPWPGPWLALGLALGWPLA